MDWFNLRLARKNQILYLFIACAIPIHFGGYLQYFLYYPSNILKFDLAQLLGLFGYFTIFILIESGIAFLLCILFGVIAPEALWKKHLPALLSSSILIIFLHGLATFLTGFFIKISFVNSTLIFISLAIASCLFFIWRNTYKLFKSSGYETKIFSILERLIPLIIIYYAIDFFGLIYVIIRNIT